MFLPKPNGEFAYFGSITLSVFLVKTAIAIKIEIFFNFVWYIQSHRIEEVEL